MRPEKSAWLVGLAVALVSGIAPANGRFPSAQQLIVHPRDQNRIWLRATHGLLTSTDRGKSWSWICEQSIGYNGTDDPACGVTENGAVLAGLFNGLSITTDNGCHFAFEPSIGAQNVVDVTVEKNDPKRALAFTSTGGLLDVGEYKNEVWRSVDAGQTWQKIGVVDEGLVGLTIDSAPSNPEIIYVSGSLESTDGGTGTQGALFKSIDDAKSWERLDIPDTNNLYQPFLSAIDPKNPDVLYVRVRGPSVDATSGEFVENRLLYSNDGGKSWQEIWTAKADMLGFALSPDGTRVLVGLGDSREPGNVRPVDKDILGLYSSPTTVFAFEQVSKGHIGCLTFDGDELWICTSQFTQGYELGLSKDQGTTIEPVMELSDPQGPVQCGCETSTGKLCPEVWTKPIRGVCALINRCVDGGPKAFAFCGDGPPDAGSGGTNGADGAGGESGCGCRTPGASGHVEAAFGAGLLLAAAAGLRLGRQRRRRR